MDRAYTYGRNYGRKKRIIAQTPITNATYYISKQLVPIRMECKVASPMWYDSKFLQITKTTGWNLALSL